MASGQKMLNTLFLGRSWVVPVAPPISDGPPYADSASSITSSGVRGGDGGSDWKLGTGDVVDQMAVSLSSSRYLGTVGKGSFDCRDEERDFGNGISRGRGRPIANREYSSDKARTVDIRTASDVWKISFRSSGPPPVVSVAAWRSRIRLLIRCHCVPRQPRLASVDNTIS